MIKKIFILCLCMLALFATVGGTVAYYVSANETNTTKQVDIIQYRMKRNGNGLETYTSNTDSLMPGVYGKLNSYKMVELEGYYPDDTQVSFWDGVHNSIDRIVSVKNNGTETIYVRTVFAFDKKACFEKNYVTEIDNKQVWRWDYIGIIEIEDKEYELVVATYEYEGGELKSNEYTYPSLLEIVVNKDIQVAHDEQVKLFVKSQAVSKENIENLELSTDNPNAYTILNAVLGEITVNKHPFK